MHRYWMFAGLCALLLAGCGGSDTQGRLPVNGSVTVDGAPLEYGLINFEPTSESQVNASASIEQGKYSMPAENGLAPGSYRVSIRTAQPPVTETDPNKLMELASKPTPPEKILPKYNSKSELKAEVKAGGPSTFDFQVTTK